jgi:hypothetical protein
VLRFTPVFTVMELCTRRSWTPSIVPNAADQTVYLVLNDFGSLGRAYCETVDGRSDLESVISDLISGQYDNPVRIVGFNTAEGWSEDTAREIMRRLGLAGNELPSSLEASSNSISVRIASLCCGLPDSAQVRPGAMPRVEAAPKGPLRGKERTRKGGFHCEAASHLNLPSGLLGSSLRFMASESLVGPDFIKRAFH